MSTDPRGRHGMAQPSEAVTASGPTGRVRSARAAGWALTSVAATLLPWILIRVLGLSEFVPAPTLWQITVPSLVTMLAALTTDRAVRRRGWNPVVAGLVPVTAHVIAVAAVHLILSGVAQPWGPEIIDWAIALVGIQLITPTPLLLWIASMLLLIDHPFRRQVTS